MRDFLRQVPSLDDSSCKGHKTVGWICVIMAVPIILLPILFCALYWRPIDTQWERALVSEIEADETIPKDFRVSMALGTLLDFAEFCETASWGLLLIPAALVLAGLVFLVHGALLIRFHEVVTRLKKERAEK